MSSMVLDFLLSHSAKDLSEVSLASVQSASVTFVSVIGMPTESSVLAKPSGENL